MVIYGNLVSHMVSPQNDGKGEEFRKLLKRCVALCDAQSGRGYGVITAMRISDNIGK